MTAVNLTVTPGRIWVSADSAVAAATLADAERMQGICRSTNDPAVTEFADEPVEPRRADCFGRKIGMSSGKRLIVSGSGLSGPLRRLDLLAASPAIAGLDELHARAQSALQEFSREQPNAAVGIAFIAGWSKLAGRCRAFALCSDQAWTPQELPTGHLFLPRPHPSLQGYRKLYERYERPVGQDVAELHLSAGRLQAEGAARGLYAARPCIAGELLLAQVDETGVRERVLTVL